MKRSFSLLPLVVAAIFPFISVQACGPFFSEDVFVRKLSADSPDDFLGGKLGVLLPTYNRADLTFAYRYLNGGALSPEEQKPFQSAKSSDQPASGLSVKGANNSGNPTYYNEPEGPADLWLGARDRYAPPQSEIHPVKQYNVVYRAGFFLAGQYENCQADAFRTAVTTLESRARAWGPHSSELADWIKAQDSVFSNCGGAGDAHFPPEGKPAVHPSQPSDAPVNAPLLLRQDRAYQQAAAQFYAAQFAASRASFQNVAKDTSSPWHGIARYLVARTLIREAFLSAKKDDSQEGMADFNPDLMKQAQRNLETMRGENPQGISLHAIQQMLNLVRLRTEPLARLHEISSALAGSKPDPDYKQDLEDLNWYLNNKLDSTAIRADFGGEEFGGRSLPDFNNAFNEVADLSSSSTLIDWLITFQSPSELAKKHAFVEWQRRRANLPWLVAALTKASADDSQLPALLEDAKKVNPSSPAWTTITYHRLRLLIDSGHAADARRELESDFPHVQATGSESALNLFTGLRMRTAPTLDAGLVDAPRKILERSSEQQAALDECFNVMQDPRRKYDCKEDRSPVEFSRDAVDIFNNALPLGDLARAAQSKALPVTLSQSIAMMTWVRAVLLKSEKVAAQMFPLLPQKLQLQAGPGIGFHPQMAILRNPGLRPFLDPGVQRSASYDFVESFADNWWCGDWSSGYSEKNAPRPAESVAFLSPAMRDAGEKETAALLALGGAEEYLGSQILDYARNHPSDPDIPETLYLTLRMIRYGCYHASSEVDANKQNDRVASIAREIGSLMRGRYPRDPWTKKAAPYVWPSKKNG
ncbi:MAG TPA: hypothetical protein VN753_18595 [Terracidiphilus sp.]|nr:hypothetical protein [Terracidiphilus sp.]